MSGIVSGIAHLFQAFLEMIQGAVNSVVWVIQSALGLVMDLVNSVVSLFGGVVGFLLGNIVTIAVIAALFYGYRVYQQRQGKTVGVKKL